MKRISLRSTTIAIVILSAFLGCSAPKNNKITNILHVDKEEGFLITSLNQDENIEDIFSRFSIDTIYFLELGDFLNTRFTFLNTDTFEIRKSQELSENEEKIIIYKQSIDFEGVPELISATRVLNNYERYLYHYCPDNGSNYHEHIRDDQDSFSYKSKEYSNLFKIDVFTHNNHHDILYAITPERFKLFFESTLCGYQGELTSHKNPELAGFDCEDCDCFNRYDTCAYDIGWDWDFGDLDYFNINSTKFLNKYPFGTFLPFLERGLMDKADKIDINEFKKEITNENSERSKSIISKGLMTNTINGDTLIIYFETNNNKLEDNDRTDIQNFVSYYVKTNNYNLVNSSLGVCIKGYSDKRGEENKNYILSKNRTNSVKDFLATLGIPTIHEFYYGETNARIFSDDDKSTIKDRKVEIIFPFSIRNILDKVPSKYYLLDGSKSMKDILTGSNLYTKWEEIVNYPFMPNSEIYISAAREEYNIASQTNIFNKDIANYNPGGSTPLLLSLRNLISFADTNSTITVLTDGGDNWGGVCINQIIKKANNKKIIINVSVLINSDACGSDFEENIKKGIILKEFENDQLSDLNNISSSTGGKYLPLFLEISPYYLSNISEAPQNGRNHSNSYFHSKFLIKDSLGNGFFIKKINPYKGMSSRLFKEFSEWVEYNLEHMNLDDYLKSDFKGQAKSEKLFCEKYYPYYEVAPYIINDFTKYGKIGFGGVRYWYQLNDQRKNKLRKDFRLQRKDPDWNLIYNYREIDNLIFKYFNSYYSGAGKNERDANVIISRLNQIIYTNQNHKFIKYFYLMRGMFYYEQEERSKLDIENRRKSFRDFMKTINIDKEFGAGYYMLYDWLNSSSLEIQRTRREEIYDYYMQANRFGCFSYPNYSQH
jgi:outer membrane protein OmpA-like peptidoglycan-associated protein